MGLHIAADCGRVAASFQRLPCQKTKPKGLRCGGGSVVGFGWYYIGGGDNAKAIHGFVCRANE